MAGENPPTTPPPLKPPISPPSDGSLVDVPVQSSDVPPESAKLTHNVGVSSVQPPPKPEEPATVDLSTNDVVDAFYEDTWRKGVVKQVVELGHRFAVSFDEESDELVEFTLDDLKLHWECVDGSWTRAANKATVAAMYEVGGKIEVSRDNGKPHYSWFKATVLGPMKYGCLTVEYLAKVGMQSQACRATVDRASIRPCPPTLYINRFALWEIVDAYWDCGWWCGVITKVLADLKYEVFVVQLKRAKVFQKHQLRTHMEYRRGKWFISSQDSTLSEPGDSSEQNPDRLMKNVQTSLEGSVDASRRKTSEVVMVDVEETSQNLERVSPDIQQNTGKHCETAKQNLTIVIANSSYNSVDSVPLGKLRSISTPTPKSDSIASVPLSRLLKRHRPIPESSKKFRPMLKPRPIAPKPKSIAPKPKPIAPNPKSTAPEPRPIAPIPKSTAPEHTAVAPAIEESNEKQPETCVRSSSNSVGKDLINQSDQRCLPLDNDDNLLWKSIETIMESTQKHKTSAPATEENTNTQPEIVAQSSSDLLLKTNEITTECSKENRTAPATEVSNEIEPDTAVQSSNDLLLETIEITPESSQKQETIAPATEENNETQPETAAQSSNDSLLKTIETTTESNLKCNKGAPATEENNETQAEVQSVNDSVDNNMINPSGQGSFPFDEANPLWKLIETITESSHNLDIVEPSLEKNNGKQPETVGRQRSLRLDEVFNKSQLKLHMKSKGGKWVISSQDGTVSETGGSSGGKNPGSRTGNLQTPSKGLLVKRSGQPSSRIEQTSYLRNPVHNVLVNQSRPRSLRIDKPSSSRNPVVNILVPGKEPFEKVSPLWKSFESLDAFKQLPQKPHFRPLQQHKKSSRESMAIALMVNFSNVVKRVSELQFSDPKSVTSDILSALTELGTHGFDVTGVLDCVINFLSLRDKWEMSVDDAKKLDEKILARSNVKRRIETEIAQMNKKMRKLEAELSHARAAKNHEEGEIAFLQARMLEVKSSIQNGEEELDGT